MMQTALRFISSLHAFALVVAFLGLGSGSAQAELRIVTTIKPIHALVAGVMSGAGNPYLMIKGAASPHTYAMKPSDAAALQQAHVVFRIGGQFEQFLTAAIKSSNASAKVVSLGASAGVRRLPYRTGKAWAGSAHDHHGHHDHHDKSVKKDKFDPHIWLDPDNASHMIAAIAETLAMKDPDRRADFMRNASKMVARIKKLKIEIETAVAPVRGRPFLVFHDAYQYFEAAFDVTAVGAVSLGESRSPGARRIMSIRRELAARKVVCVFVEPQFAPRIVRTIIEGTSVRQGMLDPVGASIEAGPDAYFELMRRNTRSLTKCLK